MIKSSYLVWTNYLDCVQNIAIPRHDESAIAIMRRKERGIVTPRHQDSGMLRRKAIMVY